MLLRSRDELQKFLNILKKFYLMISQHFFIKRPLKPFGPGAWLFGRFLTT
jgi:hypothetical protein